MCLYHCNNLYYCIIRFFVSYLPKKEDLSDFQNVFWDLAIYFWFTAAILMIYAFFCIKPFFLTYRTYGKAILYEFCIFITSTTIAGGFNYWLGKGGIYTLIDAHINNSLAFATLTISYFTLSEYIPALAFSHTVQAF
jgi:hypothetical protein